MYMIHHNHVCDAGHIVQQLFCAPLLSTVDGLLRRRCVVIHIT